jgi:hypothetical protein
MPRRSPSACLKACPGQADVLDVWWAVDLDVAGGVDGQVEETVAREGVEHVVEEGQGRARIALARSHRW